MKKKETLESAATALRVFDKPRANNRRHESRPQFKLEDSRRNAWFLNVALSIAHDEIELGGISSTGKLGADKVFFRIAGTITSFPE